MNLLKIVRMVVAVVIQMFLLKNSLMITCLKQMMGGRSMRCVPGR